MLRRGGGSGDDGGWITARFLREGANEALTERRGKMKEESTFKTAREGDIRSLSQPSCFKGGREAVSQSTYLVRCTSPAAITIIRSLAPSSVQDSAQEGEDKEPFSHNLPPNLKHPPRSERPPELPLRGCVNTSTWRTRRGPSSESSNSHSHGMPLAPPPRRILPADANSTHL